VVAALVLITGAHWAALQTVAWTTMLANNLRTQSVSEAVSHTFDGEHPCPLCRAIAAAKKSEKKSAAVSPLFENGIPARCGKIRSHFTKTVFRFFAGGTFRRFRFRQAAGATAARLLHIILAVFQPTS